jgi:phosphoribosylpyrophosphate synthetase
MRALAGLYVEHVCTRVTRPVKCVASFLASGNVIQVDYETLSGTTQMNTAVRLKEVGAGEIWAAVTHCVLCNRAPQLFSDPNSPISRLYIMDTIPPENRSELDALRASGRLHVLSWLDDIAWVIYNSHWGATTSEKLVASGIRVEPLLLLKP